MEIPLEDLWPYYMTKRSGPTAAFDITNLDVRLDSSMKISYVLTKYGAREDGAVLPSWSGFFTHLTSDVPNPCRIGYLPIIDGSRCSPTDPSVVNCILTRSVDISDKLDLPAIVVVMDEAVYAKAQQIRWQDEVLQSRLVLRLGEFHLAMTFLGTIGKRFQDGGLRDVLIESNIIATGSVNAVLSGKHYNRSVRAMKILYEALYGLILAAYEESMVDDGRRKFIDLMGRLRDAFTNDIETYERLTVTEDFQALFGELNQFIKAKSESSPTLTYWFSFIEIVDVLLQFLRATRSGNWSLHLHSIRCMLPWLFAYDRVYYSR